MTALVQVRPLKVNTDDRGELTELLRADDPDFVGFGQVYAVMSYSKGTIRAFHRHHRMYDHFIIVRGAAKFRFFDDNGNEQVVVVSERTPMRITVPPKIWHGWMALEDNTLLISIASVPYMGYNRKEEKDEERIGPYDFDKEFDGWEVEYR